MRRDAPPAGPRSPSRRESAARASGRPPQRRRGRHARRGRALGLRRDQDLPDRRDPRRAAAHRQGDVLLLPDGARSGRTRAEAYLWDPATGRGHERKDPPLWLDPKDGVLKPANIWCAGQTFTADGELVVFGGNLEFPRAAPADGWKGLNKVYTFDPFTRDLARAARHGARPLVPDRRAACPTAASRS